MSNPKMTCGSGAIVRASSHSSPIHLGITSASLAAPNLASLCRVQSFDPVALTTDHCISNTLPLRNGTWSGAAAYQHRVLSRPVVWAPGLRFRLKTLNAKSVKRARVSSEVLLICLRHNLRRDNEDHRHREPPDSARTPLNSVPRGSSLPEVNDEIATNSLDELGLAPRRKDAIMGIELVFQAPAGYDTDEFFYECLRWADSRYQHILSAVVHRDQKKPHMHVIALPIKDGRLAGAEMTSQLNRTRAQRLSFMTHMHDTLGLLSDYGNPSAMSKTATPADSTTLMPHWQVTHDPCINQLLPRKETPAYFTAQTLRNQQPPKRLHPMAVHTPGNDLYVACSPTAAEPHELAQARCQSGDEPLDNFDQEEFDERAAIMEFDGGLSREEAEAAALALMAKDARRAGSQTDWPRQATRLVATDASGLVARATVASHASVARATLGGTASNSAFSSSAAPDEMAEMPAMNRARHGSVLAESDPGLATVRQGRAEAFRASTIECPDGHSRLPNSGPAPSEGTGTHDQRQLIPAAPVNPIPLNQGASMTNSQNLIRIDQIRVDSGLQPRQSINQTLVAEYAEAVGSGAKFPKVVVFHDGTDFWLADGFHRWHAHREAGAREIDAEIHSGSRRDAVLYSIGANGTHGLRRTNGDKRKAVMTLLSDAEWGQWSDAAIAKQANVGRQYVNAIRGELAASHMSSATCDDTAAKRSFVDKHGNTSSMNVSKRAQSKGKAETKQAEAPAAATKPADVAKAAQAAADAEIADAMPTHAELLNEAHAEREAAEQRAADLEQALQADDKGAELAKALRIRDHAIRRKNELMEDAASSQRRADFYERQLARCGKAVGVRDLGKVAQAVVDLARNLQVSS